MYTGNIPRNPSGQTNPTSRGRPRSRSNSNVHESQGVIRRPAGPESRKPFSQRGGSHGITKSQIVNDPFASDEEESNEVQRHSHTRSGSSVKSTFQPIRFPNTFGIQSTPNTSTQSIPSLFATNIYMNQGAYSEREQGTTNENRRRNYQRDSRNVGGVRENRGRQNKYIGGTRENRGRSNNNGREAIAEYNRRDDNMPRDDGNTENGEKSDRRPRRQKYAIGFKKLEETLQGTPEDVLLKLLENSEAFSLLLHKEDLSPDYICLILQAMAKLADSYFDQHKLQMLHMVTNDDFMKQLLEFIMYLPLQDPRDKKRSQFFWQAPDKYFSDLNKFCDMVIKVIPTTAINKLPKLINAAVLHIPHLGLNPDTLMLFKNLQSKLTNIEELEIKKKKLEADIHIEQDLEPPDDFREINVFPQPYEIVTKNMPFLRENIVDGAYKSVEHYLDVQFRLVRNDFVKPLRDGICNYLDPDKKKRAQNVKIYNGVIFIKAEMCANASNGYLIQLPQRKNKKFQVNVENSKLFMFGSLVCFTKDHFRNIIFGRIVERKIELLKQGRLIISLHSNTDKIDFGQDYIMIESKVYFEPYYYVLSALQQINEDDFPMKEYIVDMKHNADMPEYYIENVAQVPGEFRIPITNGVINEVNWPTAEDLKLNVAQYAAYKSALSNKFAIIQGPPGTGKTYLGLRVAKTLLNNTAIWHKKQFPMLVICFTNHALDQFLEGLLSTTQKIVRIGGQSKSKNLDEFNIRNLRNRSHNYLIHEHHRNVSATAAALKDLYSLLDATRAFDGIVNIHPLLEKLPELMGSWFCSATTDQFLRWLFGGMSHKNVKKLDVSKFFAEKVKDVSNKNDVEEDEMLQEFLKILDDTEKQHNIDDDIVNVNYSGIHIYMRSIRNYTENLENMEKRAEVLKRLNEKADPREWERLVDEYEQTKFEYDYVTAILEEGKKIENPSAPRDLHLYLQNPQNMPPEDRWQLYLHWVKKYEAQILKSMTNAEANYQRAYREFEDVRNLVDIEILREKHVVGMTTTSAARLQSVLRALRSRIVVVEEAAEIMEAHIITALTKHCEHVILIGDHQQLRPSTADFVMETKYKLGISLFERMVRNKVQCNVLEIQHRMRPEISKLIVPTIYPVLHNHESVYQFPSIRGVDRNLYFIHHTNLENVEKDDSKYNMYEVKYLMNLAQYLILNGYEPEDITILCAYSAQLFKMFSERKQYAMLRDVRICVLDNYQGEESKIILLSLVRNNTEGKVGFLKIDNRICVALSRAREGFYLMGNMDMLTKASTIWQDIKETLRYDDSLGEALPLRCQVHKTTITLVKTIEDFQKVAEGGCDQICNDLLLCGHICKMQCHIKNRDHARSTCREKCLKILCDEEHDCPKMCFEECGPCKFPMERHLMCGHTDFYPCHDKEPQCREVITAKLPCGHETQKQCYLPLEEVICPHPCDTRIERCGHACSMRCHIKNDPDHLKYQCRKKCDKIRPNCMLEVDEHRCTKCCYEECDECDIVVKKLRSCSHMYNMQCSESVELMPCKKPCKKQLPCGHKCRQDCSDPCGNCMVVVDKVVPHCGHKIKIACKEEPTKNRCRGKCTLLLSCGHPCQNKCRDSCTIICKALVPSTIPLPCGHVTDIPCSFNKSDIIKSDISLLKYCKARCNKTLKCDHSCSGSCGECYQGRLHKVCSSKCGVSLICGHTCKTPCRQVCPPCTQTCKYRCPHSKCNKKCGEPCTPCRERCTRRCEHQVCPKICSEICSISPCEEPCRKKLKCGHNCIGFCGEPCPRLCRICDNTELMEEFYMGYEDEEDARFVLLEDCKHIIESRGMDMWLASIDDEINIKTCPKCKETLVNTLRYSDYVKKSLKNITAVKKKYYGSSEKNVHDGRGHMENLEKFYNGTNLKLVCPTVSTLYETFMSQLKPVKGGQRQMLSKLTVEITYAKIQILENICKLYDETFRRNNTKPPDSPPQKCLTYLEFLLKRLTIEKERMTEQEVEDYEVELKRLRRILQFGYITMHLPKYKTEDKSYQDLCDLIYFNGPYNVKEDNNIKTKLERLSHSAGSLDVSDTELQQIIKVIGVKTGAWYKCPNGHLYAIGDCGGAMVESKCADCGAKIGGRNHGLTTGNTHANIDGSRHAAWSEQANMQNYQLNL